MDSLNLPALQQIKVNLVKETSIITPSSSVGLSFVSEEYTVVEKGFNEDTIQPSTKYTASCIFPHLIGVSNYEKEFFSVPFASSKSLKGLKFKQQMLEQEDERHILQSQESKQRALLVISEVDEYQELYYYYECNLIKLVQETKIICQMDKRAGEEAYHQKVIQTQEKEDLSNEEKQSRAHLERIEFDSRNFLSSMRDLRILEIEAELLKIKEQSAATLYLQALNVRKRELEVSQKYYRPPQQFYLLSTSDPFHVVEIDAEETESRRRTQQREAHRVLYTLSEEEFAARQRLYYHHGLTWMRFAYLKGAALIALHEEPLLRTGLAKLLGLGACQPRLGAFIRIQRWWRLLRSRPWSAWRRENLKKDLAKMPRHHSRLKFKEESSNPKGRSFTIEDDLVSLSKAAEQYRYDIMMDHYLYLLGVKITSFLKEEQYEFKLAQLNRSRDLTTSGVEGSLVESATEDSFHVLSQNSLLILCRPRFALPYDLWRRTRWVMGSLDN
ncbi:unnamed protein product [Phytomonas sp. Hart1]|nr:unnamed protein product [Phytomonas sp. Hart1]|eukprot:CCW68558.1 unnamed protein product [Phytomonas sp. isolate Hart1]